MNELRAPRKSPLARIGPLEHSQDDKPAGVSDRAQPMGHDEERRERGVEERDGGPMIARRE